MAQAAPQQEPSKAREQRAASAHGEEDPRPCASPAGLRRGRGGARWAAAAPPPQLQQRLAQAPA
eukprot:389033-Lingulodinium_polyedra.AAC.1